MYTYITSKQVSKLKTLQSTKWRNIFLLGYDLIMALVKLSGSIKWKILMYKSIGFINKSYSFNPTFLLIEILVSGFC